VFEKLMESVDLAKVKAQQGTAKADMALEKKLAQSEDLLSAQNADAATLLDGETVEPVPAMDRDGQLGKEGRNAPASGELFAENSSVFQVEAAGAAKGEAVSAAAPSSQAARPFVHIPNLPPGLQQQSFTQLSQGVLQGLRNQEHHLILKLYPKELGEVKVEMTVRDNQVAVSFAMENSRVKEVLESNLEQFKENMEKQGFTMGECMVSLNRDNDGNEAWQQFQAGSLEKGAGRRKTTLADLPEDILYQRAQPGNGRENGVDLFA
jgi:flagellar hook-length control protein FliK